MQVLSYLPTQHVLFVTPVSRRMHALALRLVHNRLSIAAGLNGHTLILECYHPSAKLTTSSLFCTSLGTDGLEDALDFGGQQEVGRVTHLGSLYSRFQPQRKETETPTTRWVRAGDIPGSRTYPVHAAPGESSARKSGILVTETVSLDSHELFSQLCCVANLVKLGPRRFITSMVTPPISDGMIRVWRDWLARQVNGEQRLEAKLASDPRKDPSVLWVNNAPPNAVGIKCRTRECRWRQDNPVLISSEEDVAVSYDLDFEGKSSSRLLLLLSLTRSELVINTIYLLLRIEESMQKQDHISSKAIVFGAFG